MENIVLMKKSVGIEQLSRELGYSKTLFLGDDFTVVEGNTKKEIMAKMKGKLPFFYKASNEEMLRFVLEKTDIELIFSVEIIHPYDSVHFIRSGLDPVLCAIAANREKIIGFSFSDILNSPNKAKTIARMRQNVQLCQKYKVKVLWSTFAGTKEELRSASDLLVLWGVLGGKETELGL